MKLYKQFQPLKISVFAASTWRHPIHRHNHYEIIYIRKGTGHHHINGSPVQYECGSVFLIGPSDAHFFAIDQLTEFVYIKFTDIQLHQSNFCSMSGNQQLEYLMKSRETHFSGFKLDQNDQLITKNIIEVILSLNDDLLSNQSILWLQILALANILYRNMPEIKPKEGLHRDIQALYCYLHKYIYQPKNLRSSVLAAHFNTTADYIGPYFKRNTGETLRTYVGRYRKFLITNRLKSGNYSLKQIAAEFGLTDESHVKRIVNSEIENS